MSVFSWVILLPIKDTNAFLLLAESSFLKMSCLMNQNILMLPYLSPQLLLVSPILQFPSIPIIAPNLNFPISSSQPTSSSTQPTQSDHSELANVPLQSVPNCISVQSETATVPLQSSNTEKTASPMADNAVIPSFHFFIIKH